MHTHPLRSLALVITACLSVASCDEGDDPPPCAGAECDDKADGDKSGGEGEEATSGEAPGTSGEVPATDGMTPTGGTEPFTVPEECDGVCTCVAGAGGEEADCGQSCAAALLDEDPNDRAQCEENLAQVGHEACAPECMIFSDGS